jgi:hypothetical protein
MFKECKTKKKLRRVVQGTPSNGRAVDFNHFTDANRRA